ncbi:MAG: RluA family pseudouridine synthase [Cyanobacteria bacterium P01_F01_bin.150]
MPSSKTLNQGWTYSDQVPPSTVGRTVLDYYTQQYHHSSRAVWRSRIETGQIRVNNNIVTPDTPLKARQTLTYHRPPWYEPDVPLNIKSLYEDADLLVISKPSGLPVLPGGGFLNHTLLHQLKLKYPSDTPTPIHRLGRGTSGIMLIARSPLARSHLSRQLREHKMTKVYRALMGVSDGSFRKEKKCSNTIPDQFSIATPIGRVPHPILGYIYGATDIGKSAHSDCQVVERRSDAILLDVKILTGRPHQIRIHLAAYGYPLLGDPLYGVGGVPLQQTTEMDMEQGRVAVPGDCGYWLHAHRLDFTHPRTEDWLEIMAPPPTILRCGSSEVGWGDGP